LRFTLDDKFAIIIFIKTLTETWKEKLKILV